MKNIAEFKNAGVQFVFTDIDDTLTDNGKLHPVAFNAIWDLHNAGIKVIPVTGRPAGWCELIARQWPVAAVIGENGGFYFRHFKKKMIRHFMNEPSARLDNQKRLEKIRAEVLSSVAGTAVASDQFCRLMDLAIDYCEDVKPVPPTGVDQIIRIFKNHGAQAKISSIHINGWFGHYDKLSMCKVLCSREFEMDITKNQNKIIFIGDSPNDEPLFDFFQNSFGVANVMEFASQLKFRPKYVANKVGGAGFAEIAALLV